MASGMMRIAYGEEHIAYRAIRATSALDGIDNSFEGVRKRIDKLPERSRSGDNLRSASAFLRRKSEQYDRRREAIRTLQTRSNTFMSRVETEERALSKQIRAEYIQFHKTTGIGKSRAAFLVEKLHDGMDAIRRFFLETVPYYGKKAVKGLWDAVKSKGEMLLEWYQKNKVAIELFAKTVIKAAYAAITIALAVAAALALGAAITAATGGVGIVFAVFTAIGAATAVIDSVLDTIKTGRAFSEAAHGRTARAREIDSMSTAEHFFENPVMQNIYNTTMTVGSILGIIGSVGTMGVKVAGKVSSFKPSALFKEGAKEFADNLFGIGDFKETLQLSSKMGVMRTLSIDQTVTVIKGCAAAASWVTLKPLSDLMDSISDFKKGKSGKGMLGIVGLIT